MGYELRLLILVVVEIVLVVALEKLGLKFPFAVLLGVGCVLGLAAFCQFVLGVHYT